MFPKTQLLEAFARSCPASLRPFLDCCILVLTVTKLSPRISDYERNSPILENHGRQLSLRTNSLDRKDQKVTCVGERKHRARCDISLLVISGTLVSFEVLPVFASSTPDTPATVSGRSDCRRSRWICICLHRTSSLSIHRECVFRRRDQAFPLQTARE